MTKKFSGSKINQTLIENTMNRYIEDILEIVELDDEESDDELNKRFIEALNKVNSTLGKIVTISKIRAYDDKYLSRYKRCTANGELKVLTFHVVFQSVKARPFIHDFINDIIGYINKHFKHEICSVYKVYTGDKYKQASLSPVYSKIIRNTKAILAEILSFKKLEKNETNKKLFIKKINLLVNSYHKNPQQNFQLRHHIKEDSADSLYDALYGGNFLQDLYIYLRHHVGFFSTLEETIKKIDENANLLSLPLVPNAVSVVPDEALSDEDESQHPDDDNYQKAREFDAYLQRIQVKELEQDIDSLKTETSSLLNKNLEYKVYIDNMNTRLVALKNKLQNRELTRWECITESLRWFFNKLDIMINGQESKKTYGAQTLLGRERFFVKPNLETEAQKALVGIVNEFNKISA